MANLDEVSGWLSANLSELLAKYKVPGAAVGVYSGGQVVDFAAGVLSHATGVEATADSVFQIGSITKTWTGTLIMQLADEGLLDIDKTVVSYLPDFDLADSAAAGTMTVRQLLCHTAGFEGDIFTDTGNNDDCVEKYVATLKTDPQLFPPGEMFSYNNAGYCVLGRIVEVLRGKPFDQALREHLFAPLGLAHAATDANSAILFRAAIGHLPNPEDPDGNPVPAPIYNFAKSNAPVAGSALAMRPRDLLAFAAMHLNKGVAADGTRVLSEESVAAMQAIEVTLPPLGLMGDHWGLSWELFDLDGGRVFGHDGGTIGQSAFLRVVPGTGMPGMAWRSRCSPTAATRSASTSRSTSPCWRSWRASRSRPTRSRLPRGAADRRRTVRRHLRQLGWQERDHPGLRRTDLDDRHPARRARRAGRHGRAHRARAPRGRHPDSGRAQVRPPPPAGLRR